MGAGPKLDPWEVSSMRQWAKAPPHGKLPSSELALGPELPITPLLLETEV